MDIQLLINEYLKDKADLRDAENDSLNIVDNQIFSWNFTNILQPTKEELEALIPILKRDFEEKKLKLETKGAINENI